MILEMTIQNLMRSLYGDHPGKQWESGHQKIPLHQYLENMSQQLN
jgi:hypothetical protein